MSTLATVGIIFGIASALTCSALVLATTLRVRNQRRMGIK